MIETTTIDPQTDPVVVAARASLFDAVAAELSRDLVVASQQASHTSTDYDPYDLDRCVLYTGPHTTAFAR